MMEHVRMVIDDKMDSGNMMIANNMNGASV
jgi:hypothetical protein